MTNHSIEITNLIKKCEDFTNCLHIFEHNYFSFLNNEHKACFIDYVDSDLLISQKENFIKNLISSISDYVYTDTMQAKRINAVHGTNPQKYNTLLHDAKQTFRKPRYIIPTTITSGQAQAELLSKVDITEEQLFNSIYKLNNKKTSYGIYNYSIQTAKEVRLLFEKYRFDFKQLISQGQFSELLLYNILINYFDAIPLIHKMPITTNPNFERHGIDAIHIADNNSRLELYIGESKTYDRKQGSFKAAVIDSVYDVILHHDNLLEELTLYRFSENISEGLEMFLEDFLKGNKKDVKINLICMISYSSDHNHTFTDRNDFIKKTQEFIKKDCESIHINHLSGIQDIYLNKVIFVLFPIEKVDELILHFQSEVGIV